MSNISIFAKPAFLNVNSSQPFKYAGEAPKRGHLQRVSSMIRGDQIVDFIGAKLNPTEDYKNDVCIYVKPHVPAGHDFKFEGKRNYLDIVDGWGLIPIVEKHTDVGIIACSQQDYIKLESLFPNRVKLIPQHHCNYDRIKRTRKGIKTIGVIGTEDAFPYLPEGLEEELSKRKIKLLKYSKFFTREDIINFYKQIDLQIVWRPYRMRLSNPLKIVNASSFGIPTIAYDESVFKEMEGCYIGIKDLSQFLSELDFLKAWPSAYKDYSERCLKKAEDYHISKIGRLYTYL